MKLFIDKTTHIVENVVTFEAPSVPLQVPGNQYTMEVAAARPEEYLGKVRNPIDGTFSAPTPIYTWEEVRAIRDIELQKTDWTQVNDAPLTPYQVYEFSEWRQKLRDVTENSTPNEAYDALKALIAAKPQ